MNPAFSKQLTFSTLKDFTLSTACSSVLLEAYSTLGIDIEIQHYPPKRSILYSNSGKTDGEVMRIIGIEDRFPNLKRVQIPICALESKAYTTQLSTDLADWQSLTDYRIGIVRGHLYASNATKGMNVTEVDNDLTLFKMLELGRIDVAISITYDAIKAIHHHQIEGVTGHKPSIHYAELYHYVHVSHQDLIPQLESTLFKMHKEGRIEEISKHFENSLTLRDNNTAKR